MHRLSHLLKIDFTNQLHSCKIRILQITSELPQGRKCNVIIEDELGITGKDKVIPVPNKASRRGDVLASGRTAPHILNLCTRRR
jgi:hypothetical protein